MGFTGSGLGAGGGSGSGTVVNKTTRYTGGDIVLSTTTGQWFNLQTALDVQIAANVGDVIECNLSLYCNAAATEVWFDVVTIVAAAAVSSLANAGAATAAPPYYGNPSWKCTSGVVDKTGGPARMVVAAGDVVGGKVTFRVRYTVSDPVARTVFASANYFIQFGVKNLGPAAP